MSLSTGLQVIRGFFMSVRAVTACILVNMQITKYGRSRAVRPKFPTWPARQVNMI